MDEKKTHRDLKIIRKFIGVYCRKVHGRPAGEMCADCADLLEYAEDRLASCPFDPKPKCKECKVHCYREPYRSRMREVMKTAGIHFVKRGRVDWLIRYFLS